MPCAAESWGDFLPFFLWFEPVNIEVGGEGGTPLLSGDGEFLIIMYPYTW